jgi:predicted transcriptional regulator
MDRPDIYVLARFLEALWLKGKGCMLRTELQMAVRLNYNLYVKYLDFIVDKGLANEMEINGKKIIKITQKGVDTYITLVRLLKQIIE